ncbi:MAG: hypothetical protein H6R07_1543 [Proteobacteria bacterium]|nr:hypothetical protein [Pseudomonadota bacterium]
MLNGMTVFAMTQTLAALALVCCRACAKLRVNISAGGMPPFYIHAKE